MARVDSFFSSRAGQLLLATSWLVISLFFLVASCCALILCDSKNVPTWQPQKARSVRGTSGLGVALSTVGFAGGVAWLALILQPKRIAELVTRLQSTASTSD